MSRTVHCVKLNKEAPALPVAPYPGELGQRIFKEVSAEAWQSWLGQQTMLINENRLSLVEASSRKMLKTEMKRFLFGEE